MLKPRGEPPPSSTPRSPAPGPAAAPSPSPSTPAPTLPKGGGAIRGIGEKFAANPVTGTGSLSVPLATSPGRSGFGPDLALSYDSGAGNGPFGFGWSLSIPSISRKTDKGLPQYRDDEESDVYILSGAEDLVPLLRPDDSRFKDDTSVPGVTIHRYRPRVEGLFARIERWTDRATGDVHWRSITRDNVTSLYGKDGNSRIFDPADPAPDHPSRIFSWLLCQSYDDKGNAIVYEYAAENDKNVDRSQANERNRVRTANRYLKRILYGNRVSRLLQPDLAQAEWLFEVVFDYDEGYYEDLDPDPNVPEAGQHRRVRASASRGRDWSVRPDPFSSHRAAFEVRTYRRCHRVLMFHHFDELGDEPCLVRSTEFEYSDLGFSFLRAVTLSGFVRDPAPATYLKKSLPPLEFEYSQAVIQDGIRDLDTGSLENLPIGLDGVLYQWVDLDGEGVSGILTEQAGAWFYKRNLGGGHLGPLETLPSRPSLAALSGGRQQLLDLAGDGQLDLVAFDGPAPGFYERTPDEDWEPFKAFASLSNIPWDEPNLRFVDLDGDGHADVLITEDEVFTWYPSLAEEGFGPARQVRQALDEERGPRLVLADGTQSIYLADMCGDGLTDLVRIRNGEVCYWPNQGYGRFGPKVTMDNAPWFDHSDQFDQRRVRLADIDGSGTIDILYLGRDGVRLYFNQSGNRWSAARPLSHFPRVDDLSSVTTVDLLGNGTACLVWSSPLSGDARRPMRYIDLMGGQKPHLLIRSINNLGAETRVQYVASTKFYLADKAAGTPWITRLPFPVHVVERTEQIDHVSRTRFVSRYTYHHGYFDGAEREFRGFGMVEQQDTEAFEDYVVGVKHIEGTQELAPELYQPPVTTRTWFHTGAYLGGDRILHPLRGEYYLQQQHIPDPVLPQGMDERELRESVRALKGLPLRQEVYSFDGSPQAQHPYSVTENNYDVKRLQRRARQRHAVFFAYGCETVTHYYERNPSDPRIAQSFNLETGPYGNVLKSASVVYGRNLVDPALPAEVTQDQQRLHVTYGEIDYTPDIDQTTPVPAYRLRTPYESRSYEITGVTPAAGLFTLSELKGKIAGAAGIDYEIVANGTSPQKRLLSQSRTLFLDDNLAPLSLGQWDTLGLIFESYRLAFTPGVTAHYTGKVDNADFTAAGYVHFNGDANWWIPSGTAVYPNDPAAHFFLPLGGRDALGLETLATFDSYDLLPVRVRVTQATWNDVRATNDYRVLGPVMVTDPNQNRTAVEIDALGMVVKSAVLGKAGAGEGDTLADPTVRMEYELFNWVNHRKPNFSRVFARERHGAANPRWQESYVYSNGSGGVAMVKAQAHPGKALRANPDGSVSEVDADPRWVGNGRTILNNKGNPVKQYEPFFSTTHEYEEEEALRQIGATPILYYDAAGRNIRTEFPNGTFARVAFDPWKQQGFDANDTVLESQWYADHGSPDPLTEPEPLNNPERRAAWLAAKHAGTPGVAYFDSLGRPVYAVSDYGNGKKSAVRSETDLTGRYSKIFDQHQRQAASGFTGMAGTPVLAESAEKGRRWTFLNALGGLVQTWDEFGRAFRAEYDVLHRPTSTFVEEAGQAEILFNYIVYGDRHPDAVQLNLLGIAHQVFDSAGMLRVQALDFKRNPTSVERVLASDYKTVPNWKGLATQPDYSGIQSAASPALETAEPFTASSTYDALNRPGQVTLHGGTIMNPAYNEANFLASLKVQIQGSGPFVEFLKEQDYDAKGQRQFAHYGNDVLTRYFYDPHTFRLTNLLTVKSGDPAGNSLQNLHYTYDPVGNITQYRDDAQQTHFFSNAVVKAEGLYEYDAIYQLVKASGREHAGAANDAIRDDRDIDFVPQLPHVNDAAAVRTYTELYEYDLLGNLLRMRHTNPTGAGNWTRRYHYFYQDDPSNRTNRLASTSRPGDPEAGPYTATYSYDPYGNMTRLRTPNPDELVWNFMDQLQKADLGGGGVAYYVYSIGGQRIRKVIERLGATRTECIYLGVLEVYRERQNNDPPHFERRTLHIADNAGRIAQVDVKTRDDNNTDPANPLDTPLIRYQYGNHLGSTVLETDAAGIVISYEEYHPFGTTAYRSARPGVGLSLKRYRFSGKERDDETGLHYFGARYYASWLGRWTSSDPAGFAAGLNLYRYCSNNPIVLHDPQGTQEVVFGLPSWATPRRHPGDRGYDEEVGRISERLGREGRSLGYAFSNRNPVYEDGRWNFGTFSQIPERDPWNITGIHTPTPERSAEEARPDSSGSGGRTVPPPLPPRPALDPTPPASALPTRPIPHLDITQAPSGTDFRRAEGAARRSYRIEHGLSGRQTAVQHPQPWREGARTNTHPRITNAPDFLHPISSQRGTGGTVSGRQYATQHTYADRGIYPQAAADLRRRYGSFATERITSLWAGQRSRQVITGSRGPSFLREYIVAPMVQGAAGHVALAATRTFVPFVVEAELGLMGTGMVLYQAGYESAGVAVFGAASYAPVVGGGLVAGAVVGNAAESLAREWGSSEQTAQNVGIGASILAGAGVGALIGSVIPGVGTAAGAVVGALAGLIGYGLSKLF